MKRTEGVGLNIASAASLALWREACSISRREACPKRLAAGVSAGVDLNRAAILSLLRMACRATGLITCEKGM